MNTPNLTPEQLFWGRFYVALHSEAEKIRAALDSTYQADSSAAEHQTAEAARRVNITRTQRNGQNGGAR